MKNIFKLLFFLIACIAFSASALGQEDKTPKLATSSNADKVKEETVIINKETPKLSVAEESKNVSEKKNTNSQSNSKDKSPKVGIMNKKENE